MRHAKWESEESTGTDGQGRWRSGTTHLRCENEIEFENTRVKGKEKRSRQRKVKEGIE